jgi:hypothetical protein
MEVGELVASIVPAAPSRSILNAAAGPRGVALDASALKELEARYSASGITAFGVWVHEEELSTGALERAGLTVGSRPTAMALDLAELGGERRRRPGVGCRGCPPRR